MPDNPIPQFNTAEYNQPSAESCKACGVPLTGAFYRANSAAVCGSCAERLKREIPLDNHARFVRAVLFGLGGFAVGLALYAGFVIATGISIGYISLAVGWIVGKAMIMGSGGVGGRRYQILAVLLTYAAVSMASIPIALHYMSEHKSPQAQAKQSSESAATQPGGTQKEDPQATEETKKPATSFAAAVGMLAALGLASPFLELQDGFSVSNDTPIACQRT